MAGHTRRGIVAAVAALAPGLAAAGPRAARKDGRDGKRSKDGKHRPDSRANSRQEAPAPTVGDRSGKPSIVVLLTDDMRAEDWRALPRTQERLGSRGTTFPNFILPTPVCSPSRASILTGRYAHNHGVLSNNKQQGGFGAFAASGLGDETIAAALQRVGYRTAMIGKIMNGYDAERPLAGWDRWLATDDKDYYAPRVVDEGRVRQYGKHAYVTDVLRDAALEFIAETPANRPLFLYLSMRAPHGPAEPAKRDADLFAGAEVRRDAAFNEADVADKPADVRDRAPVKPGEMDELDARRLETLASADRAFADVLDALEQAGRLDGGYVFALSDNGYMLGTHRLAKKGDPYDAAVRVPMIAAGPGFAPGATETRLAANVDLAPTIAAAAGAELARADGRNLLGDWERGAVLIEGFQRGGFQGLRGEEYLYVEYPSGEREYYDYKSDPLELTNRLATWDGLAPTLAAADGERLRGLLARYRDCAGDRCP